jgi:hypothetical protein
MNRVYASLTIVAFLLCPAITLARDFAISDSLASTNARPLASSMIFAMPKMPDLPRVELSKIKFVPSLKTGYRRMGMNVSVPIPFEVSAPGMESYRGESVSLNLPDVNLWIVDGRIDATLTPSVKLFLGGAGNLFHNLATSFAGYVDSETETRLRRKHPLDWVEVEGGFVYYFWHPVGVVAGLRWDHFDLTIREPRMLSRVNAGSYKNPGLLASDVFTELWLPYLGVEYAGETLKLKLIGSAFSSAKVKVGTRLRADIMPSHNFLVQSVITMNNTAYFVEASMEYRISLAARTHVSLWGKSGWMAACGGGRLESGYSTTYSGLTLGILDDRDVAYSRYNLAGGVAVDLSF